MDSPSSKEDIAYEKVPFTTVHRRKTKKKKVGIAIKNAKDNIKVCHGKDNVNTNDTKALPTNSALELAISHEISKQDSKLEQSDATEMYHRRQHPLMSSSKKSETLEDGSWTPNQAETSFEHDLPVNIDNIITNEKYHRRRHSLMSPTKTLEVIEGGSWTSDQAESAFVHDPSINIDNIIAKQLEKAKVLKQSSSKTLEVSEGRSGTQDQAETSCSYDPPISIEQFLSNQLDEILMRQQFTLVTNKKSKRVTAKPDTHSKKPSMNKTMTVAPGKKMEEQFHVANKVVSNTQRTWTSDIRSNNASKNIISNSIFDTYDRDDWDAAELRSLSPKINGNRITNNTANMATGIYAGDDWDAAEALSMSPKISTDSRRRTHTNSIDLRTDVRKYPAVSCTSDVPSKKRRQEEERPSPPLSPAFLEEEFSEEEKQSFEQGIQYQSRMLPLEVTDLACKFKPLHPLFKPKEIHDCVKAHGTQIAANISRHMPFLDMEEVLYLIQDTAFRFVANPLSMPEDNISVTIFVFSCKNTDTNIQMMSAFVLTEETMADKLSSNCQYSTKSGMQI